MRIFEPIRLCEKFTIVTLSRRYFNNSLKMEKIEKYSNFDSVFAEHVTTQRIFHILETNKFKFEEFTTRDGIWDRYSKSGKNFFIFLMLLTCFFIVLFIPLLIIAYKTYDKKFPKFTKRDGGFKLSMKINREVDLLFADTTNTGIPQRVNFNGKYEVEVSTKVVEASSKRLILQLDLSHNNRFEKFMDVTFDLDENANTVLMTQTSFYDGEYLKAPNAAKMQKYTVSAVHSYKPTV